MMECEFHARGERSPRSLFRVLIVLSLAAGVVCLLPAQQSLFAATTDPGTPAHFAPHGSAAAAGSGDYITATGGMNSFYRYFLEVPPGLSRLVVQLFDADVGASGGNESTGQTSRDFELTGNYNTTATYTLLDPSGTSVNTRFSGGGASVNSPQGGDGAFVTFFDSNDDYVRDNFTTASYTNNDGNVNWAAGWVDSQGDGPAAGDWQITGGELRYNDQAGGGAATIDRDANLSAFTSATLSFNFRTNAVGGGDTFTVQVSINGGAFTNLETFTGPFTTATYRSYVVTAAASTRIRFAEGGGYGGGDNFFVDNVRITGSATANAITAGHWELQVAMPNGGDVNGLGIRANDGTAGAGGTEINVYFDSHSQFGTNGTAAKNYAEFPYITTGCSMSENDWDFDDTQGGTQGTITFTSRLALAGLGGFTQSYTDPALSGDTAWMRNTFSPTSFTNSTASDYGIWQMNVSVGPWAPPNWANVYVGNFEAAANPPTANPTPNTFRVYLPTDGGTAPLKPYMEQFAIYRSGPNPPVIGSTTRAAIEVFVVNPSPNPITFSTPTNIVTANVPGGVVLYAGNATVSQGSITAQPAVGGSGDVTWNPGTVAAGTSAYLIYEINFTPTAGTPTAAVTQVPNLTPTPVTGTRGQFVDETGNTTQARATMLFGPLCQLTMSAGAPTEAVVYDFNVTRSSSGTIVEWKTASEAGTVGFDLMRGNVKVNDRLLAGLISAPQGGAYRVVDSGAPASGALTYTLVEVGFDGRRRAYGPFTVEPGKAESTAPIGFERIAREDPAAIETLQKSRDELRAYRTVTAAKPGAVSVKIGIERSGLYFISAGDIASHFGITTAKAQQWIADNQLSLKNHGADVSWTAATGNAGIIFYGEAIDSIYARENVYWLRKGAGESMAVVSGGNPAPVGPGLTFPHTEHYEQDNQSVLVLPLSPDSDYWFWDFLIAGDPTYGVKTFTLPVTGLATSGSLAQLRVELQAYTTTGLPQEHHAVMRVNGTQIGETWWEGFNRHTVEFSVDESLLNEGDNNIEVAAVLDAGIPYSVFFVDSFDLSYARLYTAAGDKLAFRGNGNPVVTVDGFSSSDILVYDVTDPAHPIQVRDVTVDGSFRASLAPSTPATKYAATTTNALGTVSWMQNDSPSHLRNGGADYVIVTAGQLANAAGDYAAYRSAHGLSSAVVDVEDIMDEFSDGIMNPYAIRDFLAQARRSWSPAPRYVLLAGDGSYDYKDNLGLGGNLVPLIMMSSRYGLFPTDARFVDLEGNDGIPEMAIGRLPVRNETELRDYLNKVTAYESASGKDWGTHALLMADDPDVAGDFPSSSEIVAGSMLATYQQDRIYLPGAGLDAERARLFDFMANGLGYINYVGHSGMDRLAVEGLLATSDLSQLPNTAQLPVLTTLGCVINRFELPSFPSLGEEIVRQPGAGAIAAWGPTGLSENDQATILGTQFYGTLALQDRHMKRLGDVIRHALQGFAAAGGSPDMLDSYILLGDPALKLKKPAKVKPQPGDGGGG